MGLVDGVLGFIAQKTNMAREMAQRQWEFEQQQANFREQMDMQKGQIAEDKRRFEIGLERDDSQNQRRAADLKAAGINPLLAGGVQAHTGQFGAPMTGSPSVNTTAGTQQVGRIPTMGDLGIEAMITNMTQLSQKKEELKDDMAKTEIERQKAINQNDRTMETITNEQKRIENESKKILDDWNIQNAKISQQQELLNLEERRYMLDEAKVDIERWKTQLQEDKIDNDWNMENRKMFEEQIRRELEEKWKEKNYKNENTQYVIDHIIGAVLPWTRPQKKSGGGVTINNK